VEVWQTSNLRRLTLAEEKTKKKKEETAGQKYMNEYATRYAVARHYLGLVDVDE